MATTPSDSLSPQTESQGGPGLDSFFWQDKAAQAAPKAAPGIAAAPGKTIDASQVDAIANTEGLSPVQRQVMGALLGQESNNGANAATSINGARGPGQVMAGTFKQYAKPGESIDNPDHNLAVMARIVKDLGDKSGDDPARIATGYFSGPGNVTASGALPYKNDAADGNGKKVSSYVTDVLARLSGSGAAQAAEAPSSLDTAPKWSAVIAKPGYAELSPDEKVQAKDAYFQQFIAPNVAPGQRAATREWFDAQTAKLEPQPQGMLGKAGTAIKNAFGAASAASTTAAPDAPVYDPNTGVQIAGGSPVASDPALDGSVMAGYKGAGVTPPALDATKVGFAQASQNRLALAADTQRMKDAGAPAVATNTPDDVYTAKNIAGNFANNAKAFGNAAGEELATLGKYGSMLSAVPAVAADKALGTNASDYFFQATKKFDDAIDYYKANGEVLPQTVGTQIAAGIGHLAASMPLIIASGGGAATQKTQALYDIAKFAFSQGMEREAATAFIKGAATASGDAVVAMSPVSIPGMFDKYRELTGQGVDTATAVKAAIADFATTSALGAAPMGLSGKLATRIGTGAVAGAAQSAGSIAVQNQILRDYPQLQQDPLDPANLTVGAVTGAALHGVLGHEKRPDLTATPIDGNNDRSLPSKDVRPGPDSPDRKEPSFTGTTIDAATGKVVPEDGSPTVPPVSSTKDGFAPNKDATAASPSDKSATPHEKDILDYAESRIRELTAKRDGETNYTSDEGGNGIEQHQPGAGLTSGEADELKTLEQHQGDAAAIGRMYGFDVAAPGKKEVDAGAHDAATSPTNDLPEPTQAQKEAGNYKVGRVDLHGLNISIENPEGSVRSGVAPDGTSWSNTLQNHYGYIRKTEGADGDHVDAFIGPAPQSLRVFVVDQVDPKTGEYDEHKVMLGFTNKEDADAAYHANYEKGWKGRAAITETTMDDFKSWLKDGDTTKPFAALPAQPTHDELVGQHADAVAAYKAAAHAGDEGAAQAAQEKVSGARQAIDTAEAQGAAKIEATLKEAIKPKNETEATALRQAKAIGATPEQTDLIMKAVSDKLIRPTTTRGTLFREGILDATSGKPPQENASQSYLEGHAWALKETGQPAVITEKVNAPTVDKAPEAKQAAPQGPEQQPALAALTAQPFQEGQQVAITSGMYTGNKGTIEKISDSGRIVVRGDNEHKTGFSVTAADLTGAATARPKPKTEKEAKAQRLSKEEGEHLFGTIQKKQIPDMADDELVKMVAHYGPDGKRTPKLLKEIARRKQVQDGLSRHDSANGLRSENESGIRQAGADAHAAGAERKPPKFLTGQSKDLWLTGYDAAAKGAATAVPVQAAPKTEKQSKAKKASAQQEERRQKLADYFTPGNIVKGYVGHDRVLAYTPAADGGFSVKVEHVEKKGDQWVTIGEPRNHSTMPDFKTPVVQRAPEASSPAASESTISKRQHLAEIAEKLGVSVSERNGGYHAGGKMVEIPPEDAQVEGALSADHVFAHELGHAAMQKRGINFAGHPIEQMKKWASNWDELVTASKAFRPGVWSHADEKVKRHARKPNEVLADAIGSVYIGKSDPAILKPLLASTGTTLRDLGLPAAVPRSLRESFYDMLKAGTLPTDNSGLRKAVAAFDGKPAGNSRLKEAQEELEAAIAQHARDTVKAGGTDRQIFDKLLATYEAQPNLNIRTSTSIENQAYSTPAPLAFLSARLAGIDDKTTVLEPTAGTGMLLITADPKNAVVNELNDERAGLLKAQGFTPTQKDASQPFYTGKPVDAVIANPPFGSVKNKTGDTIKVLVDGFKIGKIDHLIAARALEALKDDGRATLILGADKIEGGISTDDRIFFNWLYGHYNVTSHFEADGKLYGRQGANWPVRIITVDGRQKSDRFSPASGTIQRAKTWSEVYGQYEQGLGAQHRASGQAGTAGDSAVVAGDGAGAPSSDGRKGEPSVRTDTGARSPASAGNERGTVPGTGTDRPQPASDRMAGGTDAIRHDAVGAEPDPMDEGRATAERGSEIAPTGPVAGAKPAKSDRKPVASNLADAENQFQIPYTPRSSRKDEGVLVPVNMAQPMQDGLSELEDRVGDIDTFAAKELGYPNTAALHDALMGLQVDSVASAIDNIKRNGKATIIADQTGIGKGRQAAAMLRWALRNKRVPVFISVKPQLFTDMYGDLHDIGTDDLVPFIMNSDASVSAPNGEKLFRNKPSAHKKNLQDIAATGQLPEGTNALFLTYSQINTKNTQREALLALGDKAVIVMDESHNAAGESGTGEYVRGLLDVTPGVVYLSATFAKRPDNMPLYFKTDMGDAIADNATMLEAMASGGLPLQTVISNNLVKAGQMFRRERSYDGVSIITDVDTANRAKHEKISDGATEALRSIVDADRLFHEQYFKELQKQMEESGGSAIDNAGNQASDSINHTEFSSVVHNFIRQMQLGLKVEKTGNEVIASIKRGEKPLVALENTMGSFLAEYVETNGIKDGDALTGFGYGTVLSRALDRTRYVTKTLPNGEKVKEYIPLSKLPENIRAEYARAQKVIDGLDIDIPVSPLDYIRNIVTKAGHSIAEITGRSYAVDYSTKTPTLTKVPDAEVNDKVATTRSFNDGTLDAIILNVAGSTGISLHASEKFADRRQRHMIVAQPAQDINIFMQMLGRVHRTGQVILPKYTIMTLDLPSEKRPTAILSAKMKSLNANTSSNTESATSIKSADMLNKYGDQIVTEYLAENTDLALALDLVTGQGAEPDQDIARKATGRVALLPVDQQHAFYADIEDQYKALIDYLNKTNQNDLEPRTFDFDAELKDSQVMTPETNPATPFGAASMYGEYSIKAQGKPMKPAEIDTAMKESLAGAAPKAHAEALNARLADLYATSINNARLAAAEKGRPAGDGVVYSVAQVKASPFTAEQVAKYPEAQPGRHFVQDHPIGSMWRIDVNGDIMTAVVTNLKAGEKPTGNPFSMSKIQVVLAVNSPLRTITVPASQWAKVGVAPLYGTRIEHAFRESAETRDTAKIVTGNLLAAYGEMPGARGSIISFTQKDGTIEQGILLPKKFDFKTGTRGDYAFKSPTDVVTFLSRSGHKDAKQYGVASRDGVVRVKKDADGFEITVPKSKAKGGKYFLDRGLTALTGDFVSSGGMMGAKVSAAGAVKALTYLMKKAPLYAAPSLAPEARQILNDPLPAAKGSSGSLNAPIGIDTFEGYKQAAQTTDMTELMRHAVDIVGLNRDVPVVVRDDIPMTTPMRYDPAKGVIEVNGKMNFDPGEALQSMVEEVLHSLDAKYKQFADKTTLISASSPRFDLKSGDIALEVQAAYTRGASGALRHFFTYPLDTVLFPSSDHRIQAELFARLGVLYFGDPTLMKAVLPTAYEAYHGIFGQRAGIDQAVRGAVRPGTDGGGQDLLEPGIQQRIVRSNSQGSSRKTENRLGRIREKLARGLQTTSEGVEFAEKGPLETRSDNDGQRARVEQTQSELAKEFGKPTFSNIDWWDKSVGTQFHKAEKNPHFKKVFDLAVKRENTISQTTIRAAELAPAFLPRIDDFLSAAKTLAKGKSTSKQMSRASDAVMTGTLQGESVMDGKVWSDDELRSKFDMDEQGIMLYKQARSAIDASLSEVAAAEGFAALQLIIPRGLREQVIDNPAEARGILSAAIEKKIRLDGLKIRSMEMKGATEQAIEKAQADLANAVGARDTMEKVFDHADLLKKAGYAPLMRFGKHFVSVEEVDPHTGKTVINEETGAPNTIFFGRYETEGEAQDAYFRQQVAHRGDPHLSVKSGPVNDEKYKMYQGVSPETLALFGEVIGAKEALHKFYQAAVSERSALKRRLERKNIAGFSQDMPRVLANFITSNGRHAAGRYYTRDINSAIKYIPREKGDVQKEAQRLKEYLDNPKDGGAMASSVAFMWFLGGNIASAVVNATQPVMMTLPYLTQFGTASAVKNLLAAAVPAAMGKRQITDPELRAALKRGSQEGKVDAQEIFHLYSVGIQGVAGVLTNKLGKLPLVGKHVKGAGENARARLGALGTLWGMPFAMVEGFNRRLTFIAAWNLAKQRGEADPYSFAVKAVDATQGIYNKVNRPNWARSAPGRILFTFTQFKIMNVELLKRMATMGGAEGKKAAAAYLAIMILAAGIGGLPYADDIDDLIDTVGQFLGYNTNMKRTKREWAHKTIGKFFGDMSLYGVSSAMPFDFGGRLGLGNMIPGTGLLKPSNEGSRTNDFLELGGPVVSGVGKQVFDAYDAASLGDTGKAIGALAPSAIKNAVAGLDMATTGKAKDMKGKEKTDVTGIDAASKAIGFNPTAVAEKSRANMPIQQDLALQKLVENNIVDLWAQGAAQQDQDMMDRAAAKMKDWNEKNPETPVRISAQQIQSRARQILTPTDDRLMKSAPKEMRGRVAGGLDLSN